MVLFDVYGLVSLGGKNGLPVASRNGPGLMTSNALNKVNALEGYGVTIIPIGSLA